MQTAVRWYTSQPYPETTLWWPLDKTRRAELSQAVTATSLADLNLDASQTPAEARSGGHAYKPLGAAVYCLRVALARMAKVGPTGFDAENTRRFTFEDLVNDVAMRGGDASTNAAVAGALLWAFLRYGAIPVSWNRGLRNRGFLMANCERFCLALGVIPGGYVVPLTAMFDQVAYKQVVEDSDQDEKARVRAALGRWKTGRLAVLRKRWPV